MTNSARAQSKAYNAMHSQIFFLYESAANVLSETYHFIHQVQSVCPFRLNEIKQTNLKALPLCA